MPSLNQLLIVDDNAALVAAYEPLLIEKGFDVLKAGSGEEAIALCAAHPDTIAVAIIDLKMPELDGPATIAALLQSSPQVKIIGVSGQVLSTYFSRLSDLGVRHFLPKPFLIDGLLEIIGEVVAPAECAAAVA